MSSDLARPVDSGTVHADPGAVQSGAAQLWSGCDRWLRRATQVIDASADALDAINVFPVSDSDTGSNLRLTLNGVAGGVNHISESGLAQVVQSAILSAHGNSGAILAEMITSVCRRLEHDVDRVLQAPAGQTVADLLQSVAHAARESVAEPVEGTILTVATQAAIAAIEAAGEFPDDAQQVAVAAQGRAREALLETTGQLAVLRDAGVVDAGGQAYVLLLDVLVEVLGGPGAEPLGPGAVAPVIRALSRSGQVSGSETEEEYEVMYALRGVAKDELDRLRTTLATLGNSVVIVGDSSIAQVHVHLLDAGAAVQAGIGLGDLSQIRIAALHPKAIQDPEAAQHGAGRTILSMVVGGGLRDAVESLGGTALSVDQWGEVAAAEQLTTTLQGLSGEVVILPNDMENLEASRYVANRLRTPERRIAVIPTVAQLQGLAAIAVHEPTADFDAAVVAMSTAAGHVRHGAVTIAEQPAMTMAGRCEIGDVLGVVEGDFVEIGQSVPDVARLVIDRLLAGGGELLTLVAGADADQAMIDDLAGWARRTRDALDVEVLSGGQGRYLLLIGVE